MATNTANTALDLFSQQELTRYERVTDAVGIIQRAVEKLVLRTQADAIKVHELLTDVKRAQVDIEDTRRAQVDPLNEQVRAYNATWKPKTLALETLEAGLKRKLLAFQQAERERIAREQEAARRKQEEAERAQAAALAKAEAAKNSRARDKAMAQAQEATQALMEARLEEPMDAPTGIRTDLGTSSTRMRWTFKVVNAAEVPRQFLIVDEKAIRRAVAEGARGITGVAIYEEETLATRVVGA